MKVAFAIVAHPDDIEFQIAGTLLLLKQAGYETHYMNVANGNCGSLQYRPKPLAKMRRRESIDAAKILGANFHPSLCNDVEILYDLKTLRRLAAVVREVKPTIVLTHPPQDYMEDHMNTCRLAVTATFARGMPNFCSVPPRRTETYDAALYHCMPHSLRDPLRRRVVPGAFVNTTAVHEMKRAALAAHKSQQNWLDKSQKINSYIQAMEDMSLELGKISGKFQHAEGWRRHLHYGFGTSDADPLREALGKNYLLNEAYEAALEKGS
jgi:N-acetylglucosamine malate deacetylase 1